MMAVDAHPDAQATVTDFLDYTEFFPSDLVRSLTLIGKLDEAYKESAAKAHELSALYGSIPTLPESERPNPHELRKQVAQAVDYALHCRECAHAESARLYDIAERHGARLTIIKKKLQALPQPPSRDPTPQLLSSPQLARVRKSDGEKTTRLTLTLDGRRASTSTSRKRKKGRAAAADRERTADSDIIQESLPAGSDEDESEIDEEEAHTSIETSPEPRAHQPSGRIIKISSTPKPPKPHKPSTTPGRGSNVHSTVAGISTSNALAKLTPPPPDARPGSKWMPWHKLTEYEMAKLRKQMKKNAVWTPSETMIRRELDKYGRGWENYVKAKAHAEATGEPFLDEDPVDPNKPVLAPGEVTFKAMGDDELKFVNRGMKLNDAKKRKKELLAREAHNTRDQVEMESASRKMLQAGNLIKNLFARNGQDTSPTRQEAPSPAKKDLKRSSRKRKRSPNSTLAVDNVALPQPLQDTLQNLPKKIKLTNVQPNTPSLTSPPIAGPSTVNLSTQVPLAPAGPSDSPSETFTTKKSARSLSPIGSKRPTPLVTAAMSRPRRGSITRTSQASSDIIPSTETSTPALSTTGATGKGPTLGSRTSARRATQLQALSTPSAAARTSSTKAASAEPPGNLPKITIRSDRRASNAGLPGSGIRTSGRLLGRQRETPEQPAVQRRGKAKRPVPGLVLDQEAATGKGKVSLGRRAAAPAKNGQGRKLAVANGKAGKGDEGDYEDENIDPDEPRYCICNDVSWGTMIACENDDCEREWFHLPCVGLEEIPARRMKWYCPDCRKKLKIDERGNPAASNAVRAKSR